MQYELLDVEALGRIGKIVHNNKRLITPNLIPVVHPYNNIITPSELKKFGAECIFTNAYIIYQNDEVKKQVLSRGIHQFLNFDGLIATDSGAFQQYMYKNSKIEIKPKDIEKFQEDIGSDLAVILDLPVQLDDDYLSAKNKVFTTISRAKDNIKRRKNEMSHWIGPIHGARYPDLLKTSALEMNNLNFEVYAIGGLVKAFLEYRFDLPIQILLTVKKFITPNKPLHMFGLGLPQFFSLAIACGCDLMDSAAYILYAKENRYFTLSTGTRKLEELEEFPCHCPICCKYTPKEVKSFHDKLRTELLAKHNLYLSFSELKTVRQAIREGNLWELVEQRIRNHPNLVMAYKVIKKNTSFIESYEKAYKNHGRLYASQESFNRPIFYRYEKKLINNYRPPSGAKFLIILPELDTSGYNSPTIKNWKEIINKNQIIPRRYIHSIYLSDFYGIIPVELSETFPMGQFESIKSLYKEDLLNQNSINKALEFFSHHLNHYEKCGILIPKAYVNQFNESVDFSVNNTVHNLNQILKSKYKTKISAFDNLTDIFNYFEGSTK